jgi:YaaC-like Protein
VRATSTRHGMMAPVIALPPGGARVGQTWDEVGSAPPAAVWQQIRALRHQPPGKASGRRGQVFVSALQQAEELFTAATSIGFPSRPILLFYGLSQAGRAVAAASTAAGGDGWQLRGHGIKTGPLEQSGGVGELTVSDDGGGSFVALATLLGSGSLPTGESLGVLWESLPYIRWTLANPQGRNRFHALTLTAQGGWPDPDDGGRRISCWVNGLPLYLASSSPEDVQQYLASRYPQLGDSNGGTDVSQSGTIRKHEQSVDLLRTWSVDPETHQAEFARDSASPYKGDNDRIVFPVLGGSSTPLHPFLTWWAVLFALSMLARYEPQRWTSYLAVDSSEDAVALEHLLNSSLRTCPEIILHTIRAVSQ